MAAISDWVRASSARQSASTGAAHVGARALNVTELLRHAARMIVHSRRDARDRRRRHRPGPALAGRRAASSRALLPPSRPSRGGRQGNSEEGATE